MRLTGPELIDAWLAGLFGAIDRQDTAAFLAFLAPDARFRFASAPPAAGHDAIAGAVDAFFASIAGLSHRIDHHWYDGATLACEGEVTYRRHDGREVTVPFADVFGLDGGLIARYSIYMDLAPVFAD